MEKQSFCLHLWIHPWNTDRKASKTRAQEPHQGLAGSICELLVEKHLINAR